MKLLIIPFLLFSIISSAQNKIEDVVLQNGKTITIFDDNTWAYRFASDQNPAKQATPLKSTHPKSSPKSNYSKPASSSRSSYSSTCGARTKAGGACRRTVSGGGRCWQHGG